MDLIIILFVSALVCGVLGQMVAPRDKKNTGGILGFLLGPLGVLIAALLKPETTVAAVATHPQSTSSPSRFPDSPPPLPDSFLIRRGFGTETQHYGPYTLEQVMDYLQDGTLLPTDHYQTAAGHWALLSKTGLI